MRYSAVIKGEDEIQTPFLNSEQEVLDWLKNNDPESVDDYDVLGFTEGQIAKMREQPEV